MRSARTTRMLVAAVIALLLHAAPASALSACVWRSDTGTCAFNALYPVAQLANATSLPRSGWNAQARALVAAAYVHNLCSQHHSSQSACTAAAFNGTAACSWGPAPSDAPLFSPLPSATACLPAPAWLAAWRDLTAPDACPEDAPPTACAQNYKCKYEDHMDHAHCMVDMMYMQRVMGGPASLFATATNEAQHLCAPETVWPVFELARPAPLTRVECAAAGTFTLEQGAVAAVAEAAGVLPPNAPPPLASPVPTPVPTPPTAQPPAPARTLPPSSATSSPSAAPPVSTTPPPVIAPVPSNTPAGAAPPGAPTQSLPPPSVSTPLAAATPPPLASTASTPLVTVPTCQMFGPTSCTPTLLALASSGAVSAQATHPRARALLNASLTALDCLLSTADPNSPSAQLQCTTPALSTAPTLYLDTFSPPCRHLAADRCTARPGCVLRPHGDHMDCVEGPAAAAEWLGSGPVGAEVQALVERCRVSLLTCGRATTTITKQSVDTLRSALQAPAVEEKAEEHDHHDEGRFGEETLGLRIASIFIILLAGAIGCITPLFTGVFLDRHPLVPKVVQNLAAGVILCLALVHVASHAVVELEGIDESSGGHDEHAGHDHRRSLLHVVTRKLLQHQEAEGDYGHDHGGDQFVYESHDHPFPIGMCVVVFGFVLMVLFEHIAQMVHAYQDRKRMQVKTAASAGSQKADQDAQISKQADGDRAVDASTHIHVCAANPCNVAALPPADDEFRPRLMAYLFEIGCVFHSVIIGVSLGVALTFSDIRPLLIALCFHQLLEGLGLGVALVRSGLPRAKQVVMAVVYALTCPTGVAVGIGIAYSYDSHSLTARAVQGVLNGVSAGMLLYLASMWVLTDMWSSGGYTKPWHRLVPFTSFCVGIAAMAVLAMWA